MKRLHAIQRAAVIVSSLLVLCTPAVLLGALFWQTYASGAGSGSPYADVVFGRRTGL